mgnify:CR=1 FL=1
MPSKFGAAVAGAGSALVFVLCAGALFTGLRLSEGIGLRDVETRYGVDVWARYGEELLPFVDQKLLIYDGDRLRLSRAGMLLAHEIMAVFINADVR